MVLCYCYFLLNLATLSCKEHLNASTNRFPFILLISNVAMPCDIRKKTTTHISNESIVTVMLLIHLARAFSSLNSCIHIYSYYVIALVSLCKYIYFVARKKLLNEFSTCSCPLSEWMMQKKR